VLDFVDPIGASRRSAAEGRQGSMKPLRGGEGGARNMAGKVGLTLAVSNQSTQTAESGIVLFACASVIWFENGAFIAGIPKFS
jgi:hypothetical protein